MGIAMAIAAPTPFPKVIAKAVPKTPPTITSGGKYAPTEIAPINTSSRDAPIIIP